MQVSTTKSAASSEMTWNILFTLSAKSLAEWSLWALYIATLHTALYINCIFRLLLNSQALRIITWHGTFSTLPFETWKSNKAISFNGVLIHTMKHFIRTKCILSPHTQNTRTVNLSMWLNHIMQSEIFA